MAIVRCDGMTLDDYKRAWELDDLKLVTFLPEVVAKLHIPEKQRQFLVQPGLPESAAPFLDFGGKHYIGIPSVAERWKQARRFGDTGL